MSLVSATGMSAAAIEGTAAITAGAGATGACNGLAVRGILWRREKHLPQRKGCNAGEHQQQHAKMHPTGRVHSGVLSRLGCQIPSTRADVIAMDKAAEEKREAAE